MLPTNAKVHGWKVPHLLMEGTELQCVCVYVGGGGCEDSSMEKIAAVFSIYDGKLLQSSLVHKLFYFRYHGIAGNTRALKV